MRLLTAKSELVHYDDMCDPRFIVFSTSRISSPAVLRSDTDMYQGRAIEVDRFDDKSNTIPNESSCRMGLQEARELELRRP
jgi:hypothetical protein